MDGKSQEYKNILIGCDTDSILICKPDQTYWSKEEQERFLNALNSQFPEKIKFEHDGVYTSVLIVASKNYALLPEGETKIKIKGSSLKDQKREPAIKEMIDRIIKAFIERKEDTVPAIYQEYVNEVLDIKDITRWCSKKTVTEAVLNCNGYEKYTKEELKEKGIRANETSVWDAIKNEELVSSGDKIYVYPAILGQSEKQVPLSPKQVEAKAKGEEVIRKMKISPDYGLRQPKYWNKDEDKEHLLKRLYSTIEIFSSVLDIKSFKNYSLVKNYKELLDNYTKNK